jgi:hypothetical protein
MRAISLLKVISKGVPEILFCSLNVRVNQTAAAGR